jgi:hypothetical protein
MPHENHLTIYGAAFRTQETVVLETRNSVPRHVHQHHFITADRTLHRPHLDTNDYRAPPIASDVQLLAPGVSIGALSRQRIGTAVIKPRQVPTTGDVDNPPIDRPALV